MALGQSGACGASGQRGYLFYLQLHADLISAGVRGGYRPGVMRRKAVVDGDPAPDRLHSEASDHRKTSCSRRRDVASARPISVSPPAWLPGSQGPDEAAGIVDWPFRGVTLSLCSADRHSFFRDVANAARIGWLGRSNSR